MSLTLLVICSLAYVALLFFIAWWVDKRLTKGTASCREFMCMRCLHGVLYGLDVFWFGWKGYYRRD